MNKQEILDMFKNCYFLDGELTEADWYSNIAVPLRHAGMSFDSDDGATKCVILPHGANYVFKIPYNGTISESEQWDEEAEEWYYENGVFFPFEGAVYGYKKQYWDYCYSELIIYNKARAKRVEKFFCKTRLFGRVDGHPIYIQERATSIGPDWSHSSKEERESTEKFCEEHNVMSFNAQWQTDAINYYGEKRFLEFMKFLEEEHISDLHCGNIGYVGDRPVLLDFASFWD